MIVWFIAFFYYSAIGSQWIEETVLSATAIGVSGNKIMVDKNGGLLSTSNPASCRG
ncbi:MAG: hypothetical protein JXM70_04430 [Pirellulales bacterium]|nr:hypothetical protein [Pirellulales bacterium]